MIQSTPIEAKIQLYISCYEKFTHLRLNYAGVCNPRMQAWMEFVKQFTVEDLELVIVWLKELIRKGQRREEALLFRNLIQDPYKFEEDLAMAKAWKRNRPIFTNKDRVVASMHPVVAQVKPSDGKITAKPISQLINEMRQAANEKGEE